MKYLQILGFPFVRKDANTILIDEMMLTELKEQVEYFGPMTMLCIQLDSEDHLKSWGPSLVEFKESDDLRFVGFPAHDSIRQFHRLPKIRSIITREVKKADIIHSSNLFPSYFCLAHGHFLANALGKKTIMVIAEDFYDMLQWEWVRPSQGTIKRLRREKNLADMDKLARKMLSTASLSFINTPGAVNRYRDSAKNGIAIRHINHELNDVINDEQLREKFQRLRNGAPLRITALARHNPIKGLDFFIHAIHLLRKENIPVEANIYGFGELTDYLTSLAKKLSLEDCIQFPGAVKPGEDLLRVMRQSDVFVMPHRTNDFGRTFYDAMTGGTPVVAFESGSSSQTVYHMVDGVLVPMDNVIALYQGLSMLHYDRERLIQLSFGAQRRARTDTRSNWLRVRADKLQELKDGLIQ